MQTRGLRLALAISVVLNLFVLGVFGGAAWMWAHGPGEGHGRHGRPILSAADTLPPADQQRFRDAIHAVLVDARPLRQAARASRRAAAAAFVQPVFDANAVSTDLAQARQADFALRTRLEGAVVAFASGLPQGERASLAQGLSRRGPLRGSRRRDPEPPAAASPP